MDFDLNVGLGLTEVDDAMSDDSHYSSEDIEDEILTKYDKTGNGGESMDSRHDCVENSTDKNDARAVHSSDDDDLPAVGVNGCMDSSNKANSKEDTGTDNRVDEMHDCTKIRNGLSDVVDPLCISFYAREIEKKLEVGSRVVDVENCYLLYCEYARLTGFSVRRGDQRYYGRGGREMIWKDFVCSCRGETDPKSSNSVVAKFRKMVTRTNCMARIRVRIDGAGWKIEFFEKNHNHVLVDIDQSYLLRSSRKLSLYKQVLLEAFQSSGIPVNQACGFMEKMSGGPQNTGFIRKDAYNHLHKKKRVTSLVDGDSSLLIEHLVAKSNSDPYFFWKVEKDDEGRLMNLFYRDSRCASDYKAFGDVLSLDTTFGTNRYKLSCAPFVGLNHHRTNVMFGIGFLSDEKTRSFKWLLEAFLESMNGIAPKVVFTDQCKALMNAIDSKFPDATHRLCQWHINRNAMSHFGPLVANSKFREKWFTCMNRVQTVDEFEILWTDMMNSFNIQNKSWFNSMYEIRHRWASVFSRSIFTAGLHATSRSECTNKVLKACAKSSASLYEFICSYEDVQSRWRALEREEDTRCMWLPGQFVDDNPLLIQAATVYTRKVYKAFERECANMLNVFLDWDEGVRLGEDSIMLKARRHGGNGIERTIIYNPLSCSTTCSCGKWEREGLLCRHILRLYFAKNILKIPETYILRRWTKQSRNIVAPGLAPQTPPSGLLASMEFACQMTKIVHELSVFCSIEARADIEETITSLRDRVLGNDGGAPKKKPAKKKRRADDEMAFHDPSPVKEGPNVVSQKKGKEITSTKGTDSKTRRSGPKKSTAIS